MLKSKFKLLFIIAALGVVILAITNPSMDKHFDQFGVKMVQWENQHIQTCQRCQATGQPLADRYDVDRTMLIDLGFDRRNYLVCSRLALDGPGNVSSFGMLGAVWVFGKDASFPCPTEIQIPTLDEIPKPDAMPTLEEIVESKTNVVIILRLDGSLEYDGATISREDLKGVLEAVVDKGKTKIFLLGNANVKVATVTEIMEWIESLGLGFSGFTYMASHEFDF